jgi:hypothetical protein
MEQRQNRQENTMATDQKRTPNDQRSDVKNPNNSEHKQDRDNRANQQNPNNPAHPGGVKKR